MAVRPDSGEAVLEDRIRWPFVAGALVAITGAFIGLALHATAVDECVGNRADVACQTQMLLMAVAFALGALALVAGVSQLRTLAGEEGPRFSWLETVLALLPGVALVVIAVRLSAGTASNDGMPAGLTPMAASVLGIPMVLAIDAVRQMATKHRLAGEFTVAAVGVVLSLRKLLRQSLTHLGAYLAVSILAVGAIQGLDVTSSATIEPETVAAEQSEEDANLGIFVFGAFFTTLLAAYYLPAQVSVDRFANAALDGNQPLPSADSASFSGDLANRASLEMVLGLGTQPLENLRKALLVLAPLVSGISTIALPG